MRTNTKKVLGAVAVAGVVATGGTAFTAGLSMQSNQNLGAGSQTVTGAQATSIDYVLTGDGQTVTKVEVTFAGDLDAKLVESSFNGATRTACSQTGVTGGVDGAPITATHYDCAGTGTAGASSFALLVTDAADTHVSRVS